MDTIEKLKNKLPKFIEDTSVLQSLLGAVSDSIDTFVSSLLSLTNTTSAELATGSALDSIGVGCGISRQYNDSDEVMRIRVQNSVHTHQARGSKTALLNEGGHICGITPYIQNIVYAIGVDALGIGNAIGGVGGKWLQIWDSTNMGRNKTVDSIQTILPLHNEIGLNYITNQYVTAEKNDIAGEVVVIEGLTDEDGNPLSVDYPQNSGFEYRGECLMPKQPTASFHQIGIIDLGENYTSYLWIVDWLDYARWDVDYDILMYVRFSDDQSTWTQFDPYIKNQFVNGENIARYVQFRFDFILNEYEDYSHYLFRKFIMKGMDTTQILYGEYDRGIELQKEILN